MEFIQQEEFSPCVSVLLTSLESSSCFVVLLLFVIIFADHRTLVCELILHSCLLLCYSCSIIVLWTFPVNQENVSGALFKVDFVNARHKFGTDNPSKHPGEILVGEYIVKVWQKAVHALLQFEENKPISSLVNQEPEEERAE
jgi:hypothetical protein